LNPEPPSRVHLNLLARSLKRFALDVSALPGDGGFACLLDVPLTHGAGGGGGRPLPALPCSASLPVAASAPHLLQLPSRAHALVSAAGCPQTSFFSLLCTPVVLTCPWLPEPQPQRLTKQRPPHFRSLSVPSTLPSTPPLSAASTSHESMLFSKAWAAI
jgi:hypothetical protein